MLRGKSGIVVALVAVAVVGIAAIAFFMNRAPATPEDVTGAIGAADRYRAEQITDEDVILDIPGEDELIEALYETLTDEQKADLLDRLDEFGRTPIYAAFQMDGERLAALPAERQGEFWERLPADERITLLRQIGVSEDAFAKMNLEGRGALWRRVDVAARDGAFVRANINEAKYQTLSAREKASIFERLGVDGRRALAGQFVVTERAFQRMDEATQGRLWNRLDDLGRSDAAARVNLSREALERATPEERTTLFKALDTEARGRLLNAIKVSPAEFGAMTAEGRAEAIGRIAPDDLYAAFAAYRIDPALFRALNPELQVRLFLRIDHGACDALLKQVDLSRADFERMDVGRQAEEIGRLDDQSLSRATDLMGVKSSALAAMTDLQRGAMLRALPSEARTRCFAEMRLGEMGVRQMSEKQVTDFWGRLSERGQFAALRYMGADEAGFGNMASDVRRQEFQRAFEARAELDRAAARREGF